MAFEGLHLCSSNNHLSMRRGSDSHFRTAMWEFIFDTTRYARAAAYLCRAHNLRIFRFHRDSCLLPHESRVQNCSEAYMAFVFAATKQLAAHNPSHLTDETAYADYMKGELTKMYCLIKLIVNAKWMSLMRLVLMFLHIPWLAATQCELVSSDLDDCAHQLGMTKLPNNSEGFGFGFGSVRDVELMCR
ncbi:hypothetical protein AHF37_05563 [Paragonimus kellicotti]|nr:hypothetical protein AHF37_05563 [Paragonimus kellicotti]